MNKKQFRKAEQLMDRGLEKLDYFSYEKKYGKAAMLYQHPQWLLLASATGFKGILYYNWYRSTKEKKKLDLAQVAMKESLAIIEARTAEFGSEQAMASHRLRFELFFNAAVIMAMRQYESTQSEADFEQAFQASERHKNFVLRQGLNRQILTHQLEGERKVLLDKELAFQTKRRQLTQQLASEQADQNQLIDEMLVLQKQEADFYHDLKNSPSEWKQRYFINRHDHSVPSLQDLREQFVDERTALIEYHFSGATPVAFVLLKEEQFHIPFDLGEGFYQRLQQTLDESIPLENKVQLSENGHYLYQQMFQAIDERLPKQIEQLIIVPDNLLRALPFDLLLQTPTAAEVDIEKWPFLLHRYAIGYVYSTQTYLLAEQLKMANPERPQYAFMGFNVSPNGNEQLEYYDGCSPLPLPELSRSSKAIADLFPRGQSKLFDQALKLDFVENAAEADVIYLAMHGCVDGRSPLDYGLQFYDQNKGLFTINELLSTSINARLIVMGSCETATEQLNQGEGIASIARAIRRAGGLNLLASLDQVNDQFGAMIYRDFFEQWIVEKENSIEALAKAKRAFLRNPNIRSGDKLPNKWASMISIGKPIYY
ncbi:MAG: CHAT domain-containing protein [Bacteroidota bacterium]